MAVLNSRTGDQALVRDINQALILKRLRESTPLSRARLSELTGLNKTTVSSIVRELIDQDIIREIGAHSNGTGRPGIMLELNPNAGCIVSAEIGVDFITVIRANFMPEIHWRKHEPMEQAADVNAVLAQVIALLRLGVQSAQQAGQRVFGVTIGVPGLVDRNTGNVLFAPNLAWHSVLLEQVVEEALGLPVTIDNEANMATLGELYFGVARGYRHVVYLSIGIGLGGGIISDGRLFAGNAGFAGEFGHMPMDPNGRLCNCGSRGCFETLVSQPALYEHIQRAVGEGRKTTLSAVALDRRLTLEAVIEAARTGDQVCLQACQDVGLLLGRGVAGLANAFDPELIVFGGGLSAMSEFLLPHARAELARRMEPWRRRVPDIIPAQYTRDACLIGGVATVYDRLFNVYQ
jgi:glucokinase-like ROK family protein